MTSMNKVFADLPVTVFEAMSQAARDNNAINLGQGFPDDPGPEDIRRAAADATRERLQPVPVDDRHARTAAGDRGPLRPLTSSRSTRDRGHGHLRRHRGAASTILALVEPGDEVVCFQPVYDAYLPIIRQAGGIPRLLRLDRRTGG